MLPSGATRRALRGRLGAVGCTRRCGGCTGVLGRRRASASPVSPAESDSELGIAASVLTDAVLWVLQTFPWSNAAVLWRSVQRCALRASVRRAWGKVPGQKGLSQPVAATVTSGCFANVILSPPPGLFSPRTRRQGCFHLQPHVLHLHFDRRSVKQ